MYHDTKMYQDRQMHYFVWQPLAGLVYIQKRMHREIQ